MRPGDLVAIVRTGAGMGALQQFTSDKRLLYAALNRVKYGESRVGASSFAPLRSGMRGRGAAASTIYVKRLWRWERWGLSVLS